MKKFKQVIAVFLAMGILGSQSIFAKDFGDITTSKYQNAIVNLANKGIIKGVNGDFNPSENLTKVEAAALLQRAFKLATIPTKVTEEIKDEQKQFISTDTTVANLSTAVLPAAKDAIGHWGEEPIETILEARLLSLSGQETFDPSEIITSKEFALAVAKAVYGVEKEIDFIAKAKEDGIFPADLKLEDKAITREEAAYLLDSVVGNEEDFKIITVFATSDIHGNLVPYTPAGSKMEIGSVAKMSYIINELKTIQPNMLILDGGDSPYNTNIANLFKGKSTVDVMNAMGYDATALGNHDFDYEFENLLELADRADYAMLSANTYMADGSYPDAFKPYIIKEVAGMKVAIVGLTDDESKLYTHYTNTKDIEFKDEFETAKKVIAEADAESDIVIVLAHLHTDNNVLPTVVEGIDVEIGGGNDTFGRPEIINGTWVINPGGVAASLNQMNINIYKGEMVGTTFNQIIINDTVPDDKAVKAVVDSYIEKMDDMMSEVIGQSEVDVPWSSPIVRTGESALANIIADSQREYMEADIALQNGGGVRAAMGKGDITLNTVYSILPFDNKVIMIEAPGTAIWEAIENGLVQYPETGGRFLQVSGLSYTFDGAKPVGDRVVSVTMPDGKPLDMNKKYKVVINDFMAGGGDGYTMFNVLNKTNPIAEDVTLLRETNDYIRDVFAKYVRENKTIKPELSGRITILNPQKGNSKLN